MPIEQYCNVHTITPMLAVPAIGATMGVEYTYELQTTKTCHVRQTDGSQGDDADVNASKDSYKIRFDSDPQLGQPHLIRFGSLYLQYEYTKVVRNGLGEPKMWIVYAGQMEARQDP